MEITNSFTVDAPIDEAWDLLTNLAEIAPCLPGAKLTDETDGVYSGGIKIKVGPVTAEYKGSAEFVEKDQAAGKVILNGKGRDTRGAGNAQALITAQMTAVGEQTKVDIVTDLKVSGKVAQFGRGVMQDISTKLLGQFAECLEAKIGEPAAIDDIASASAAASGATDAAIPPSMPSPPPVPGSPVLDGGASDGSTGSPAHAAPDPAADVPETPAHAASPTTVADAKPASSSDDDDVLDLGDFGLGNVLAKRAAPVVGAIAGLGLLYWLIRKIRS